MALITRLFFTKSDKKSPKGLSPKVYLFLVASLNQNRSVKRSPDNLLLILLFQSVYLEHANASLRQKYHFKMAQSLIKDRNSEFAVQINV